MSKFFEDFRDRVKNIPNLIKKRLVHISIFGDSLVFGLPPIMQNKTVKQYLDDLIIKVNDVVVFDADANPFNFDLKLNEKLYLNKEILEIYDKSLKLGDHLGLIVPNRSNITAGFHKIVIATHSSGVKASFNKFLSLAPEEIKVPITQSNNSDTYRQCKNCGEKSSDPDQVICEFCGSDLKE